MNILNNILQIDLPWDQYLNQGPITPGLSTENYSTFYYVVIILGVIILIFILIYGLAGEEKEEEIGYE